MSENKSTIETVREEMNELLLRIKTIKKRYHIAIFLFALIAIAIFTVTGLDFGGLIVLAMVFIALALFLNWILDSMFRKHTQENILRDMAVLDSSPETAHDFAVRGTILLDWDAPEVALPDFENAHLIDPDDYHIVYHLGHLYYLFDRHERAVELFDKLIPCETGYEGAAMFFKGKILEKTDPVAAEKLFEEALQLAPEDDEVVFGLVRFLLSKNRDLEGARILGKALDNRELQHYPELHELCGRFFLKEGKPAKALNALNRAIKLDNEKPGLYLLRADIYEKLERYAEAEHDREKAKQLEM